MVKTVHKLVPVVLKSDQPQPHERPLGEIEPLAEFGFQLGVQPRDLLGTSLASPIQRYDRCVHSFVHRLQRTLLVLPHERGPEHGMSVEYHIPRAHERVIIQVTLQEIPVLHQVNPGAGIHERMKQHPLLHRRERIDRVDMVG